MIVFCAQLCKHNAIILFYNMLRCNYKKTMPYNDVPGTLIFAQPGMNLRLIYYFRLRKPMTETEVH